MTVLIDTLPLPLTAEVTSASVRHLDLQEDLSISATYKALEAQASTR